MTANCNCDVCDRADASTEIVSSGIAPVSYGLCRECKKRGAENIGVIEFWIASFGGPDAAPDFCAKLVSYFDGGYRKWQQIRDHYNSNEEHILASFNEEFELADDEGEQAE